MVVNQRFIRSIARLILVSLLFGQVSYLSAMVGRLTKGLGKASAQYLTNVPVNPVSVTSPMNVYQPMNSSDQTGDMIINNQPMVENFRPEVYRSNYSNQPMMQAQKKQFSFTPEQVEQMQKAYRDYKGSIQNKNSDEQPLSFQEFAVTYQALLMAAKMGAKKVNSELVQKMKVLSEKRDQIKKKDSSEQKQKNNKIVQEKLKLKNALDRSLSINQSLETKNAELFRQLGESQMRANEATQLKLQQKAEKQYRNVIENQTKAIQELQQKLHEAETRPDMAESGMSTQEVQSRAENIQVDLQRENEQRLEEENELLKKQLKEKETSLEEATKRSSVSENQELRRSFMVQQRNYSEKKDDLRKTNFDLEGENKSLRVKISNIKANIQKKITDGWDKAKKWAREKIEKLKKENDEQTKEFKDQFAEIESQLKAEQKLKDERNKSLQSLKYNVNKVAENNLQKDETIELLEKYKSKLTSTVSEKAHEIETQNSTIKILEQSNKDQVLQHKQEMQNLENSKNEEMKKISHAADQKVRNMELAASQKISAAESEKNKAIKLATNAFNEKVNILTSDHAQTLEKIKSENSQEVERLAQQHESELEQVQKKASDQINGYKQEMQKLLAQNKKNFDLQVKRMQELHQKEMDVQSSKINSFEQSNQDQVLQHKQEMQNLTNSKNKEIENLKRDSDQKVREHEGEIEQVRDDAVQEIQKIKAETNKELEQVQKEASDQVDGYKQEMQKLLEQNQKSFDLQLKQMQELHQKELDVLNSNLAVENSAKNELAKNSLEKDKTIESLENDKSELTEKNNTLKREKYDLVEDLIKKNDSLKKDKLELERDKLDLEKDKSDVKKTEENSLRRRKSRTNHRRSSRRRRTRANSEQVLWLKDVAVPREMPSPIETGFPQSLGPKIVEPVVASEPQEFALELPDGPESIGHEYEHEKEENKGVKPKKKRKTKKTKKRLTRSNNKQENPRVNGKSKRGVSMKRKGGNEVVYGGDQGNHSVGNRGKRGFPNDEDTQTKSKKKEDRKEREGGRSVKGSREFRASQWPKQGNRGKLSTEKHSDLVVLKRSKHADEKDRADDEKSKK